MTAAVDLKHGRYVVIDEHVAKDYASSTITSSAGAGRAFGVIRFKTAAQASDFIRFAEDGAVPGAVLGRATTPEAARQMVDALMDEAFREYHANNRFLSVQVQRDGTITVHVPNQSEPKLTISPDDTKHTSFEGRVALLYWMEQLGLGFSDEEATE